MGKCKKNSHILRIHFILQKLLLPLFADLYRTYATVNEKTDLYIQEFMEPDNHLAPALPCSDDVCSSWRFLIAEWCFAVYCPAVHGNSGLSQLFRALTPVAERAQKGVLDTQHASHSGPVHRTV